MLERLARWWRGEDLEARAIDSFEDHPGLTEQLLAVQGIHASPWYPLSIRQLLGIPAVWRGVNLISGLVGSLSLLAYRDGALMPAQPRLVQRPDPFGTPRDFYMGTAWNMVTRGEAIWYHGATDTDGEVLSLLNLPLNEVVVDWDENRWARKYTWRNKEIPSSRITHIRKAAEPGEARGVGPFQLCGAALSAAAEADDWAARYFAENGVTAVHLHSEAKLTDAEADTIRRRWIERDSPIRVTSGGVVRTQVVGTEPEAAQLLQTRLHARGEVAVMLGIPAKLLEYAQSGSGLTYQNVGDVMTEFVRQELAPGYLEPIEQAMSDLLTRRTIARFDVSGLQRADPKTRYEIHAIAIAQGIYDAAHAQVEEGLAPGSPELMPVLPNLAPVEGRPTVV
jgi:HK97 family phage portal protein